jgi:hypothetical protein
VSPRVDSLILPRRPPTSVTRDVDEWFFLAAVQSILTKVRSKTIVGQMNPLRWMFQFVFGCHHRHMSRVFTIKGRTYKVCFDCGEEFALPDADTSKVA